MSLPLQPLIHTCPRCAALLDISDQDPFSEVTCPSCAAEMRVRAVFNHFEIVEPIASGGMGTVYKACDTNLNRIVALKLIRKEFSVDAEYISKLEFEATVTASVSHPNVVKVFSFGCDQGLYYIAMELVDKGSLDDLMTLQGRIAEAQVLEIGIQAAEGLRAAYQAGLIHRDVKPGNILFADAHTSKIVDFGLALPLEQAQEASEDIWGTPYYVAPEKLNHDPEDFRSDIYSLGGTLFHALAGRPPFEADNASLVALKHLKNQPVSLQTFAPDISSPTSYVINRTLAKDPDERYQSYDELIEHLTYARTKLLEHSGKAAVPKARVVVEGEDQQRFMGYIFMAALVFVVIIAGVVFLKWDKISTRNQSPEERERLRSMKAASSAEEQYANARQAMLKREPEAATALFSQLAAQPRLTQPLKGWTLLLRGISAYLSGFTSLGKESFAQLGQNVGFSSNRGENHQMDFFQELSRLMERGDNPHESVLREMQTSDFEPLGLFSLGLRDWSLGRYEQAAKIFEMFLDSHPKGVWEWVEQLKPAAQEYITDYENVGPLLLEVARKPPAQREAYAGQLQEALKGLQRRGRLRNQLHELLSAIPVRESGTQRVSVLRDQVAPLIGQLNLERAEEMVKNAKVAPFEADGQVALQRKIEMLKGFLQMLSKDLGKYSYSGTVFVTRSGLERKGAFTKASDTGIVIKENGKEINIAWASLAPATLVSLAESVINAQQSASADVLGSREWALGAYLDATGKNREAKQFLLRAAAHNPKDALKLSWFSEFR